MTTADGETVMTMYTVYNHPTDHPGHIVVRAWDVVRGDPEPRPHPKAFLFDYIDLAREWILGQYPGAHRLPRQPSDDPKIAEVWI